MLLIIHAVNKTAGNNYFQLIGEHASAFPVGAHLQVRNSTANDGLYSIASATNVSGYTRVSVVEPIPSTIADGQLNRGVYKIDFSDATLPGKAPVIIAPATMNESATSISLPARGAWDYGERLVENAVHMLENFASRTAPAHPTVGQQWFDYNNKSMKTFVDGQWSNDVNIENGVVSFKDPQNATPQSKVFITAAEPAGRTATGLTVYPEHDVAANSPIFRVLSSAGDVHFSVRRSDSIRTDLRFVAASTATNEFQGKVAVGTPTNAFSAGSTLNVKGHVDVSGRIIFDESATSHGLVGGTSGSSIKIVSGLWSVTSTNADAAVFSNDSKEVARIGSTVSFNNPTAVNSTLTVTGVATLSTTNVNGTLTATMLKTDTLVADALSVPGSFSADANGSALLKNMNAGGMKITNLATPTADADAATKKYVDDNDYLSLMADVSFTSLVNGQSLTYNNATSKWVNSTLTASSISGFGGSVKDQAAEMITAGTHSGLTATYDSSAKVMTIAMSARPLALTGDAAGSGTINWGDNTSIALTLATTGVTAGTYTKVTVDAKGRVLVGSTLAVADIPSLPASKITSGNFNLQNTYKVYNAIDPVDAGDYVTLRYLQNYTFDAGTF